VLICAWDVPISPILPILPFAKSITYLFSIRPFVVPFQNIARVFEARAAEAVPFQSPSFTTGYWDAKLNPTVPE
jgi:hypothetical protein